MFFIYSSHYMNIMILHPIEMTSRYSNGVPNTARQGRTKNNTAVCDSRFITDEENLLEVLSLTPGF